MKIIIALLAFLNGAYMLADGLFVMIKGKYIGPDKPGPWAGIFQKASIDVFKLRPLFVVLGIAWMVFLSGLLTHQPWAYLVGLIISILTLWYLPIGTIISVIILILLLVNKSKLTL